MAATSFGSQGSSAGSFSSEASHASDEDDDEKKSRKHRDTQMMEMRARGMSYREIKKILKCPEAESTLRGRMRVLTKPKEDRVRKPEWEKRDVRYPDIIGGFFLDGH